GLRRRGRAPRGRGRSGARREGGVVMRRARIAIALLAGMAGCAQIFGFDKTYVVDSSGAGGSGGGAPHRAANVTRGSGAGGGGGVGGGGGATASSSNSGSSSSGPCMLTKCGGMCVDTTSDTNNCGMCGKACDPGQDCVSGQCICTMGKVQCVNVCADINS